ncbi:MAG: site-specific DNA-methyltransferase [Acidobacteria bacterium]|nr:site-specific DNA-methyltransferase [Acidobacteriota bacterium]
MKKLQEAEIELLEGDCLQLLPELRTGSMDLVYLDPPFFTQKVHKLHTRARDREFSFADLWVSHSEYAAFLYPRLRELRRVLTESGSLFFHCDRNASHVVRALLDEVFGVEMFRAEIIWHYRRWSNAQKGLLPAHQTIFFYTKSDEYVFHPQYQDYSPATNVDQILQRRKRDEFGKAVYDRDADGQVIANGGKKGVPLSDVWDLPYLNPKAKERVGYPTQKPVLLLERIIALTTNPGAWVLDPFCGSGTTLVATKLLGRHGIGMDVSAEALELARRRVQEPERSESNLLNEGRESYRQADERLLALLEGLAYVPVQRNKGIDAILKEDIQGRPVLIRIQRPHETVLEAAQQVAQAAVNKQAAALFVIKTNEGGVLPFFNELPAGVRVIEAPALEIVSVMEMLRMNSRIEYDVTDFEADLHTLEELRTTAG